MPYKNYAVLPDFAKFRKVLFMAKYSVYVFDFDLTLADSSEGILKCFQHTLSEFGYEVPDDTTIYNTIGLTLEQAFTVLVGVTDKEKIAQMRKCYVKKADEVMVKCTRFYDNAIAVLQVLQSAGVKVGIVSTKYAYRIRDSFAQQAGSFPVDEIVGGEDVSAHKPDPEGLNMIIKRFNAENYQVLYIGDSYIDAQTAQNAGVDFAGVTTGSTTRQEFEKYPNVFIGDSLLEIIQGI